MNACPPAGEIDSAIPSLMNEAELIYRGTALTLNREHAVFPNGHQADLEIIRHPGGAGAVAIDTRGRVCLIRQYRHAAGSWLWEIPAGRIDQGESPPSTAERELAEEAGLIAAHWSSLGELLPSPGICDERIHLYLAQGLSVTPHAHESLEFIEIHWVPFSEAVQWALRGEINDAKTVVALLRAQAHLQK
jgi:ADP-ribose pyrophosphatase